MVRLAVLAVSAVALTVAPVVVDAQQIFDVVRPPPRSLSQSLMSSILTCASPISTGSGRRHGIALDCSPTRIYRRIRLTSSPLAARVRLTSRSMIRRSSRTWLGMARLLVCAAIRPRSENSAF